MKKVYLAALMACFTPALVNAQVGNGGFPLSYKSTVLGAQSVSKIVLERPNFEQLQAEDEKNATLGIAAPYRVGVNVTAGLDIHKDGTWSYLEDGTRVWRLKVQVPDAQAVAVYYDAFFLPQGASLYLTNENGRQILGAYTAKHNPASGKYSNQPVQGSTVTLELNIAPSVNVSDIQLSLKTLGAYYKGLDADVIGYGQQDPISDLDSNAVINPTGVLNSSASCHRGANCPEGDGDKLNKAKKATARIVISNGQGGGGIGFCSGTLINNTANSANGECKPLFLTASHCDGANSFSSSHFDYWQFRFDYQRAKCDSSSYPNATTSPTLTEGAKFLSRSNYPSMPSASGNALVQDFLLLELNDNVPDSFYLAGWNRNTDLALPANEEYYTAFYGFHHPGGDLKKLSRGWAVNPTATFNQSQIAATHWGLSSTVGGSAGGSSGSGLFDIDGLLIGDLSGGPGNTCQADGREFGAIKQYSKLSFGWDNGWEQNAFPATAGAQTRLKDHLDPANTGLTKLEATLANCSDMTNLGVKNVTLADNVANIYPNPSNTGVVTTQFNFDKATNVTLNVVNVLGQTVATYTIFDAVNNTYQLDLSAQANGIYMINIVTEAGQLNKKVIINK